MIRIRFVGDGKTEARTLPQLVAKILDVEVQPASTEVWRNIRVGKGYAGKLAFVMRQASDAGDQGVVAVVDRDREPKGDRLRTLRDARVAYRAKHPLHPTAVGEADPHGEAWLLDDPIAIREALQLDARIEVLTVRRTKDPKDVVNSLIRGSKYRHDDVLDVLTDIASRVDSVRCYHMGETGFGDWVDDVRSELGPVAGSLGSNLFRTENP
jgi:hypothetical protein